MQVARTADARGDGVARDEGGGATPSPWTLLRIWVAIGLQSFGGGASTQLLIRREFVERRPWVGADEFSRFWNLCLFTPGINLVSLTILIGRKLGGTRGIAVSLAGLLLPSAAVTCLLATGYEAVQHSPVIHAVLRGIIPATAGIMAVVAFNFAYPLIQSARKEGRYSLGLSSAVMIASTLALVLARLSVVAVLAGVAVLGVALFTPWRAPAPARQGVGPSPEDKNSMGGAVSALPLTEPRPMVSPSPEDGTS